jgi:glyceraldehyde 3-phosphate dehydrogenase
LVKKVAVFFQRPFFCHPSSVTRHPSFSYLCPHNGKIAATMAIRVGINGMGRIGKVVFRILSDQADIELVGINDLMELETLVHLIRYDSTHGIFKGQISSSGEDLVVNGKKVHVSRHADPEMIPWKEWGVDIVLESSGRFTSGPLLEPHLRAGASKVILSCPAKGALDRTVVIGVNDQELTAKDRIVSNASCTTNCLAPVLKLLDTHYGIDRVFMNTIHPFTNNQVIIDAPHKDLRRARTAGVNIIPTTSTAIEALTQIMPELNGRFDGLAVRVPVHDGSLIEISAILQRNTDTVSLNRMLRLASENELRGILAYTDDPIVSADIIGDPHSGIVDGISTKVLGGNYVQLIVWYDNETGYSNRIVDLMHLMGKLH